LALSQTKCPAPDVPEDPGKKKFKNKWFYIWLLLNLVLSLKYQFKTIVMVSTVKLPNGFSSVHMPEVNENYFAVYHSENWFGTKKKVWVAGFNESTKTARPTHGYFPPHKTGNKIGKFFKSIEYNWIYS
jgi:hypothetical protein